MKIHLFPTTNNRYAFAVQCAVIFTATTVVRQQIGHVHFPFADDVIRLPQIFWFVGAVWAYWTRFKDTAGIPSFPLTTNRYPFILGSGVICGLFWAAQLQSKTGGFLFSATVWMAFVAIEYPSRRTRGITKRELFAGVAAIGAIGFALAVVSMDLLEPRGPDGRPWLVLEPQWAALVISGYSLFWGGIAVWYDWQEQRLRQRRAVDEARWAAEFAIPREPQAAEAQRLGLGLGLQRRR